jgi:putative hemolysin
MAFMLIWELSIVVLLILLNGFFAMSEMALVSARRARLQNLAASGSRGAKVALKLNEDPTGFLSTVQFAITLVGILAGAYSGATLASPLADWLSGIPGLGRSAYTVALGSVVFLVTYLSLIVGELVPKRVALSNPERVAAFVAPPMAALARFATPFVWMMRLSTDAVLGLLRIRPTPEATVTEDEVKTMIAEGTEAGVFHVAEREMIERVLQLADRSVRTIMTPRYDVVWIDPADPPEEIRRKIRESGHSRFPVSRETIDEFEGVVHAKDLLARLLDDQPFDIMACLRQPLVIHEGMPVLRLLEMFRQSSVHMAIVVDEYGGFEGMVTPTDILGAIAGELPEHEDLQEPDAVRREDGSWLLAGTMPVEEVERLLGRKGMASNEDFHTLAGFILWQLGRMPAIGETMEWEGLRFEIIDLDGRRIDRVLVSEVRRQLQEAEV